MTGSAPFDAVRRLRVSDQIAGFRPRPAAPARAGDVPHAPHAAFDQDRWGRREEGIDPAPADDRFVRYLLEPAPIGADSAADEEFERDVAGQTPSGVVEVARLPRLDQAPSRHSAGVECIAETQADHRLRLEGRLRVRRFEIDRRAADAGPPLLIA